MHPVWYQVSALRLFLHHSLHSNAPFEFYDPASPIYTSPRFLPPAKIEQACSIKVRPRTPWVKHMWSVDAAATGPVQAVIVSAAGCAW